MLIVFSLVVPWNKLIRLIGNFKSRRSIVSYQLHKYTDKLNVTKWQKILRKLMYRTFIVYFNTLQLAALKTDILTILIRKLLLLEIEKSNYVLRYFCNDRFSKIDLGMMEFYSPSEKNRWSTRLDESNDRNLDYNLDYKVGDNIEGDLLKTIYYDVLKRPNGPYPHRVNYAS